MRTLKATTRIPDYSLMCPNRYGLLTEEQIVKLKQTHDTASPAL